MGGKLKQTYLQRRHTDGQKAHGQMPNITTYQRNASPNYTKASPHTGQNGHYKKKKKKKNLRTVNASLLHCWWECKLVQPLWRTVQRFFKKLKNELPYDPAILLMGIYPEKIIIQKDTCNPMFIAALFTIPRTWMQANCQSIEEWMKKMWYIYTIP